MPVCEGCFTQRDEEHINGRSERLELAARFRPVRIKALLLDGAPPPRAEDYFYRVAKERSLGARRYFDELMNAASVPVSADSQEAALEFQRKEFFLTYCVECPFEGQNDPEATLRRVAPTVLKRVQSIDPAYIVPISKAPMDVIRLFGMIGWGDRLVLDNNLPSLIRTSPIQSTMGQLAPRSATESRKRLPSCFDLVFFPLCARFVVQSFSISDLDLWLVRIVGLFCCRHNKFSTRVKRRRHSVSPGMTYIELGSKYEWL